MQYTVYVIKNPAGKQYVGHTNNLERRLAEHNNGFSRYTARILGPWVLIYHEQYSTRGQAMVREKF